jgi:hypothetical protein
MVAAKRHALWYYDRERAGQSKGKQYDKSYFDVDEWPQHLN